LDQPSRAEPSRGSFVSVPVSIIDIDIVNQSYQQHQHNIINNNRKKKLLSSNTKQEQ